MMDEQQRDEHVGDTILCPICSADLVDSYSIEFARNYPGLVCRPCDGQAINSDGEPPDHNSMGDFGDNPVFIASYQCWRRYKFGGYVTMLDPDKCSSIDEFYSRQFGMPRSPLERMVEQANRAILEGENPSTPQGI